MLSSEQSRTQPVPLHQPYLIYIHTTVNRPPTQGRANTAKIAEVMLEAEDRLEASLNQRFDELLVEVRVLRLKQPRTQSVTFHRPHVTHTTHCKPYAGPCEHGEGHRSGAGV